MARRVKLKRWAGRIWRGCKIALALLACAVFIPVIVALGRAGIECRPRSSGAAQAAAPVAPPAPDLPGYVRPEDQTYLTLPEWYIVYSSDEYAAFIVDRPPSQFPYFQAVGQFWQSYYDVCAVTRDRYPFNGGYHLSLAVIGTSFTIENVLKGLYENTFGRLSEALSSPQLTAEDAYAQTVATEYGTFLHTVPWYEFPFGAKLRGLWSDTPLWGPNMIRKIERKSALSAEYGLKAIYAWLIGLGTQGVYAPEDLEILLRAEGMTPELARNEPRLHIVRSIDQRTAIVRLPRYEAFTEIAPQLARRGVRLTDIAGNDEILITVIAPSAWTGDLEPGQTLFAMPILTRPDAQRVAIRVPVAELHTVLGNLERRGVRLEHIYDY